MHAAAKWRCSLSNYILLHGRIKDLHLEKGQYNQQIAAFMLEVKDPAFNDGNRRYSKIPCKISHKLSEGFMKRFSDGTKILIEGSVYSYPEFYIKAFRFYKKVNLHHSGDALYESERDCDNYGNIRGE